MNGAAVAARLDTRVECATARPKSQVGQWVAMSLDHLHTPHGCGLEHGQRHEGGVAREYGSKD